MSIRNKAVTLTIVLFCSILFAPPPNFNEDRSWKVRCFKALELIGLGKRIKSKIEEQPAFEKEGQDLGKAQQARDNDYLASDFPQSELAPGGENAEGHLSYANWAAQNAEKIVQEFESGTSIESILSRMKKSRMTLAKEMGSIDWKAFGRDRIPSPYFPDGRPRTTIGTHSITRSNMSALADGKIEKAGGVANVAENTYTTLDKISISCSGLEKNNFGLRIRHTRIDHITPILKDVMQRLENLRRDLQKTPIAERQQVFLKCMFGYYNAMPYERGSSAIGRSFFAGIYKSVFRSKVPVFVDAINVKAMILSEEEFVRELMQLPELVAMRGK
jgi:hypothetical protein